MNICPNRQRFCKLNDAKSSCSKKSLLSNLPSIFATRFCSANGGQNIFALPQSLKYICGIAIPVLYGWKLNTDNAKYKYRKSLLPITVRQLSVPITENLPCAQETVPTPEPSLITSFNHLMCGKAFAASQALSSSADSFAVIGRTRVNNLAFFITAIWTLHMKTSE